MSQLSSEDSFRLNVLLNQNLQAVRIDEGKMMVYALTDKGEARVQLNPNLRDDAYIRNVKELLSTQVLGSPGGYPVFLKRWTRMGQARDTSLESLLKLGEPEAVVAVVHAAGLSDELARRAWWIMPNSENARRMLDRHQVVNGGMGKVLAEFLAEFLPFEEQPKDIIESVRLVLQPGLIDDKTRMEIWKKGQRKNVFRVGFLLATPDAVPEESNAHPRFESSQAALRVLADDDNVYARQMLRVLDKPGQAFMKTVVAVMNKPNNQDVVIALMRAVNKYFFSVRPDDEARRDINDIMQRAESACQAESNTGLAQFLNTVPDLRPQLEAMLAMSLVGEALLNPVFSQTDAIGTVMRRKLEPVTKPFLELCNRLQAG